MRIAVGGLLHETNTFSTLPTIYDDFRVVRGEAMIDRPFWRDLAAAGCRFFPLFVAHATPSGRLTAACLNRLLNELLDGLRSCLPLDGILLKLHGAMDVRGIGDGETAILQAVRELVGPETLIAVTLDLHANLAPEVVVRSDLVTAYRTAPHRDVQQTEERGARLLIECLQDGIRPVTHMLKLPLLVAGEAAVTEEEPAQTLYARLPAIDRLPGVLVSSILIGCAWTDSPHTRVSIVVSGREENAVRQAAMELAQEVWEARARFAIGVPTGSIDESIRMAYSLPERPIFVSDSGDNTTAGAAGDSPTFLQHLVSAGVTNALVAGITDPAAVEQCFAVGIGRAVDLSIGGKLDRTFARPYLVRAKVKHLASQTGGIPPRAVVQIGQVEVVLQTERRPFTELNHFETLGIDIRQKKLIVVKLGYLCPELRDFSPRHIIALSPGFSDQRIDRLPYRRLERPIYPLDPVIEWPEGEQT